LLHYLKGAKKEHGLLINFGSYKFQIQKFAKSDRDPISSTIKKSLSLFAFLAFFRG